MDRRVGVALFGVLVASALVLLPGLGLAPQLHPLETGPTSSIDTLLGPLGTRLGHALLGILAIAIVALAGSPLAALALLVSPAFVLAGRSSAGGIAVVAPIALAGWGTMAFLESSRTRSGVLALVGVMLAVLATGPIAGGVLVVAVAVAAARGGDRVAGAWTIATIAAATLGGSAVVDALGGRLWPGPLDDARSFDRGIGGVVLGLYPLALALPACFALRAFGDRASRFWLVHALGWMAMASLWPDDPALLLAPAAPLAIVAGSTWREVTRRDDRAVVVALATVVVALLVARSFSLDGSLLVGAHAPEGVPLELPLGKPWWLAFAIAGAGGALVTVLPRGRALALGVALAACGAIVLDTAYRRWPRAARENSLVELVELAQQHGVTLHLPLGLAARQLAAPGCHGVLVPTTEIAALQRALAGRFFVIGPERVDHVLATSCLPPGIEDANPLRKDFLQTLPSPLPGRQIDAEWDGKLRLVAVDAPAQSAIDRPIAATLVFEVLAPLAEGTFATLRLEGCGNIAGHHDPLLGRSSPRRRVAADAARGRRAGRSSVARDRGSVTEHHTVRLPAVRRASCGPRGHARDARWRRRRSGACRDDQGRAGSTMSLTCVLPVSTSLASGAYRRSCGSAYHATST